MDLQTVLTEVQSWPVEDRLRLIEEVWDGLAEDGPQPELTEELKTLLDQRLDALDQNPDAVVPWESVEARALKRFRQ
jgi:putative addiction module component (TIGR02574 family)